MFYIFFVGLRSIKLREMNESIEKICEIQAFEKKRTERAKN